MIQFLSQLLNMYVINLCIKQDQMSNRYDSILQWFWMEYGLSVTDPKYPKSRDAIESKKIGNMISWISDNAM